jgi:hypothetical protein
MHISTRHRIERPTVDGVRAYRPIRSGPASRPFGQGDAAVSAAEVQGSPRSSGTPTVISRAGHRVRAGMGHLIERACGSVHRRFPC